MGLRPFRFGYQIGNLAVAELRSAATLAEEVGFDVVHTSDHLGQSWPPLETLTAVAGWTRRIRLCPLVLNNDLHHPLPLAQRLAALDRLSEGRLEVGLGAGHSFPEYRAMGQEFDPAPERKARMMESARLLRRLLDGETVSHQGPNYHLDQASSMAPAQAHLPLLIGVNGRRALAEAAQVADVISLTMSGRTLADGQHHAVHWQSQDLDRAISAIREGAGERWPGLELNALVQAVVVTQDRRVAAQDLADRVEGLTLEDALTTPFLALGTHEQIADHLLSCRARWGISYFSVRAVAEFAPVIERLRRLDQQG